ncbi:hypothetical protein K435DRAFT_897549 [Dendrothele bispora CBS 962.96]|uniref:Uncharacterized protein n=1 Tax=Dendrothele bispora (strain CBS 962.96) TaxID=1314807 RepID=A0A4S8LZU1_DENBC|nr:hypothetical protein K435DRAFT_897549 [Dendrothele bispora CBS 962.96]
MALPTQSSQPSSSATKAQSKSKKGTKRTRGRDEDDDQSDNNIEMSPPPAKRSKKAALKSASSATAKQQIFLQDYPGKTDEEILERICNEHFGWLHLPRKVDFNGFELDKFLVADAL